MNKLSIKKSLLNELVPCQTIRNGLRKSFDCFQGICWTVLMNGWMEHGRGKEANNEPSECLSGGRTMSGDDHRRPFIECEQCLAWTMTTCRISVPSGNLRAIDT